MTHRIKAVTEENGAVRYTTRGDANNTDDQKQVEQSQIQGIYKGRKKSQGQAMRSCLCSRLQE